MADTVQTHAWQPIETAPKDGTYILVFEDGAIFACSWEDDIGHDTDPGWSADGEYYSFPTHWMPLPKPPAGKAGA